MSQELEHHTEVKQPYVGPLAEVQSLGSSPVAKKPSAMPPGVRP